MRMSERTIIFHIGGAKCGSSAIQTAMARNATALAEQGVIVATQNLGQSDAITGEQIRYFETLFNGGEALADFASAIDRAWDATPNARALVLSAENLSNPYVDPVLLARLAERYRIEVVLYIRRQDEYFSSAWQQWGVKQYRDVWSFVLAEVPWRVNWQNIIESWMQLVPAERLHVRLFERDHLVGRDVVTDFYSVLGVDGTEFVTALDLVNPTFNLGVGYLASAVADSFAGANDNTVYQMVHNLTGDRHLKRPTDRLFSAAQQRAILAHYTSSNRWVRNQFFAELDRDELFAPVVDGEASDSGYVQRQADAALFDMIIELFKRSENA